MDAFVPVQQPPTPPHDVVRVSRPFDSQSISSSGFSRTERSRSPPPQHIRRSASSLSCGPDYPRDGDGPLFSDSQDLENALIGFHNIQGYQSLPTRYARHQSRRQHHKSWNHDRPSTPCEQGMSDTSQVVPSLPSPPRAKKKMSKHLRCYVPGCRYASAFARRYELERHVKTKHLLEPAVGNKNFYRCRVHNCRHHTKFWTRLDKFREHVLSAHPEFRVQDIIELSTHSRIVPHELGLSKARSFARGHDGLESLGSHATNSTADFRALGLPLNEGSIDDFIDLCDSVTTTLPSDWAQASSAIPCPQPKRVQDAFNTIAFLEQRIRSPLTEEEDTLTEQTAIGQPHSFDASNPFHNDVAPTKCPCSPEMLLADMHLDARCFDPTPRTQTPDVSGSTLQDRIDVAALAGKFPNTYVVAGPIRRGTPDERPRQASTPYTDQQHSAYREEQQVGGHKIKRYRCVFYGSHMPGVKHTVCSRRHQYISQLKRHHQTHQLFHCRDCCERLHSAEELKAHEASVPECARICVKPDCPNYMHDLRRLSACDHPLIGARNSSDDVWKAIFRLAFPNHVGPGPEPGDEVYVVQPVHTDQAEASSPGTRDSQPELFQQYNTSDLGSPSTRPNTAPFASPNSLSSRDPFASPESFAGQLRCGGTISSTYKAFSAGPELFTGPESIANSGLTLSTDRSAAVPSDYSRLRKLQTLARRMLKELSGSPLPRMTPEWEMMLQLCLRHPSRPTEGTDDAQRRVLADVDDLQRFCTMLRDAIQQPNEDQANRIKDLQDLGDDLLPPNVLPQSTVDTLLNVVDALDPPATEWHQAGPPDHDQQLANNDFVFDHISPEQGWGYESVDPALLHTANGPLDASGSAPIMTIAHTQPYELVAFGMDGNTQQKRSVQGDSGYATVRPSRIERTQD